jgi:hypothetical protein
LVSWASLFDFAVYFLLFLLAATVVLGVVWAKYGK